MDQPSGKGKLLYRGPMLGTQAMTTPPRDKVTQYLATEIRSHVWHTTDVPIVLHNQQVVLASDQ